MDSSHFRIVFKGEIFPGYDKLPVMRSLKALCNYDDETLTKMFSGQACIIKDRIVHQQAQKYKAALEQTGIICHIQEC